MVETFCFNKWIKSSNNNVILRKFKNKIYFGVPHPSSVNEQYKIRFCLQILHNF